jgi:integrase
MAILAECPVCRRKQAVTHKACSCGVNLDAEKKSKKVKYHVVYRLPDGKQVWRGLASFENCDPCSISDARKVEAKFNVCKKENKLEVFDVRPEATMTFKQLSDWYLSLEKVKALKSYVRTAIALNRFNEKVGHRLVKDIKPVDLENYQSARKAQRMADATVDMEVSSAKSVIRKAFDNDMVSGKVFKTFSNVRKILKVGSNIRDRVLSVSEADNLIENAPSHLMPILLTAYETGMRRQEVFGLCWSAVNVKDRVISLGETKNGRPRMVPMTERLFATLKAIPRDLRDKEHVFLLRGKPVVDIRDSIEAACERVGIEYGCTKDGFTLHSLRHTVNTDLRKAGVQESVINAIIGHVDGSMFGRYNTIDLEDLRQAMTRLEAYRNDVRQIVRQKAQVG